MAGKRERQCIGQGRTDTATNRSILELHSYASLEDEEEDHFYVLQKEGSGYYFLTGNSLESDIRFWKSQWGDHCFFCHGSNQSAGVAILLNKLNGDVIETLKSEEGTWIILIQKLDGIHFIICNVYGYNNASLAKQMFTQLRSNSFSPHIKMHLS